MSDKRALKEWGLPYCEKVPGYLNPHHDVADLYVIYFGHLPVGNAKSITVEGLLEGAKRRGELEGGNVWIVENTSGNTGLGLLYRAPAYGAHGVILVVKSDIPIGKRYPLVVGGAHIIPPEMGLSGIATARKIGGGGWVNGNLKRNGIYLNLDQYSNLDGPAKHAAYTGPALLHSMQERYGVTPTGAVAGIGTGGTLIGVSTFLRDTLEDNVYILGVLLAPEVEIPGVRQLSQMTEIGLPWREACDTLAFVLQQPSYLASMWLGRATGLPVGPSSALPYIAAVKEIAAMKATGSIERILNDKGRAHVALLAPDGSLAYGDRYDANLPLAQWEQEGKIPFPWEWEGHW